MKSVSLPSNYNYVGVFLTFACNMRCSYCLNHQRGARQKYKQLSAEQWIKGLNRLQLGSDMPITLQGGEPTLHPEFYKIVNGIDKRINIDLLTNGRFDVDEFMKNIKPDRMRRNSPYASIRFSYHPDMTDLSSLMETVLAMMERDYSVGVWIVDHPKNHQLNEVARKMMVEARIDCRMKEFLGEYGGKWHGTYTYPKAVDGKRKSCLCKPSELLIAPDGSIHRCHYELYSGIKGYAHILDSSIKIKRGFVPCLTCGLCNSCDIKLKTDRFQKFGHCSVEIKEI